MSRKLIGQESFTGGELTPKLHSRASTKEYTQALKEATNCILTPHGPIQRRNGSKLAAEVKDSSAKSHLLRYQFSQDLSYILEFGNLFIRFYTNSGQVVETSNTITGITNANPAVVTSTSHGYSNGDSVYITGVVGMTEVNSSTVSYTVAGVTANTFELSGIDSTAYTAYSSAGISNKIYEIVSPYTTVQLAEIEYSQSGSTLYLTHPDVPQQTLVRSANTDWTIAAISFSPPPTYEPGYISTGFTVTPAATTGTGINFTSSGAVFLEADIGRQIINASSGETGRAAITSITSTTVAVCDIVEDFTDTNAIASADWSLDLSPLCDLEFDVTQAGAIANIRSEYTNGSLGDRKTITAITNANPGVVTSTAHGFIDGEQIQVQDIVGMTQINNRLFTVDGVTANTFQLKGEDTTAYTVYASGGIARKVLTGIHVDAFRSADVGKYILANGGVLKIITVNAADDVDAEILKSLNTSLSTGNWTLEDETWSASRGYPRAVGLFEQRLIYGGTTAQPQTIMASELGIFTGFGVGPDDEDSIQVELVSNEVNQINWISAGRDLVIGTSGGEITLSSGTTGAITPNAIKQQPRTYHGSRVQQIAQIKNEIIFIQGSDRKVRTFRYDFNIDGYTGEDLTFLAEHITEGGLKELAFAEEPDTILYVVTTNGKLLAGTYDRAKDIIGWAKFETDGTYENVQAITNGEVDQVWVTVKRTINGVTKRYIEFFTSGDGEADLDGYSDSYISLSNPLTITGINNANPAVVTSSSHGLSNGDSIVIKNLVDPEASALDASKENMSSLNSDIFIVANQTANTFELTGLDTTLYNAYGTLGDCWLRVTSLSGLDHLEGKTVQIKVDGATHADLVVSSGALLLNTAAGEISVGLRYTSTIVTLDSEFDIGLGSMQGQKVRWARPLLKVYKSTIPLINGQFIPSRNAVNPMGQKVPLYSGFIEAGNLRWSNGSELTITVSDPLPFVLTGITGTIEANVK